jgi:activating signal cointegrator 1
VNVVRSLSLIQPWATLVAIGAKKVETRSWATAYRGAIAIHASKGFPGDAQQLCYDREQYKRTLQGAGFQGHYDLPCGGVLAVAELVECVSTDVWRPPAGSDEEAFGNYSPGRFGWKLEHVRRLRWPLYTKGSLGIWTLPRPITEGDLVEVAA